MEYRSKYKAEEIEAILDTKNNDGAGVDANLDGLFTDALQTKEVEVSADTTIKADEGFLGLKEVSVKVSGGGGSASTMEYWDISANNEIIGELALFFPWVRNSEDGSITSAWGLSTPNANITAIVLDRNAIIILEGVKLTVEEFLQSAGLSDFTAFGWKQITEEEFYTL